MSVSDQTCRRPVLWSCSAKSDRGKVRQINEDAWFADTDIGLWAVADGMGGHQVGDVASRMVVEALASVVSKAHLSDLVDDVEARLLQANCDIIEYTRAMFADEATMGSTFVSLILKGQVGACLWTGDSRLYRLRRQQLTQLSHDHSQVQEMIDRGELHQNEAHLHPQAHVITRAIGVEPDCFIDLSVFNAHYGDVFLLCSDGLSNTVSWEQLVDLLPKGSADDAASALIEAALAQGAPDNVTVIVIKSGYSLQAFSD